MVVTDVAFGDISRGDEFSTSLMLFGELFGNFHEAFFEFNARGFKAEQRRETAGHPEAATPFDEALAEGKAFITYVLEGGINLSGLTRNVAGVTFVQLLGPELVPQLVGVVNKIRDFSRQVRGQGSIVDLLSGQVVAA